MMDDLKLKIIAALLGQPMTLKNLSVFFGGNYKTLQHKNRLSTLLNALMDEDGVLDYLEPKKASNHAVYYTGKWGVDVCVLSGEKFRLDFIKIVLLYSDLIRDANLFRGGV